MHGIFPVLCFFFLAAPLYSQVETRIHDPAKADRCYRLVSSRNLEAAHLLRPDGRVVHTWHYAQAGGTASAFSGFGMTWHYAEMLPDGHLVAIIKDEKILELDWLSNPVWEARLRAHHDFARTPEGHTLVVSRQDRANPWGEGQIALDELVELDKKGDAVWIWKYSDHSDEIDSLVTGGLPPADGFRDWPHINTCEILPDNPAAAGDSRFRAGNLLLCGRHANAIFIVDRHSGAVVWAWGPGELEGPHMPTMLANGHLLIYDNGHHRAETARGYSRVIELDPLSGEIVWQYLADPPESFYSPSRGSANRLANGNTLIAESDRGRLFEVTSEGEVVWEYWNPDLHREGERMPLYRTVPYEEATVQRLAGRFGAAKDVIPEQRETLEFRSIGPDEQYKQMIREVVFYLDAGYHDLAIRFLDRFMEVFANDPEGYFALSLFHAVRRNPLRSFDYAVKAVEAGLPPGRFICGLHGMLTPLTESALFQEMVRGEENRPVHGPMLGHVTDESAQFWVRTFGVRPVQVVARPKGGSGFDIRSKVVNSDLERECTAVLDLTGLSPRTTYEYRVKVGVETAGEIYSFTTFPRPGEPVRFSTGFGGGAGYTPKHERMWDTLRARGMPFFMLLGDNVYIDHPERPAVQKYCYYRRQSRPEFKRFSARSALYAIWDDHDFTFNDGKGSPFTDEPGWKRSVWRLFRNQWNNPYYGGGEKVPGCWFDFSYGDVDFFMLDCRYYREQPGGRPEASMLGAVQKEWLFEKLKNSRAVFKVIASSVPWAGGTKPGSLDTWDGHPVEREEIFRFIERQRIEGVLLISADRHRSDARRIERPGGYTLYDLESSKLTNIHTHEIIPGAIFGYNKTCSFGCLEFDTARPDPQVSYVVVNIDGEEIHRLTLYRSELSFSQEGNPPP